MVYSMQFIVKLIYISNVLYCCFNSTVKGKHSNLEYTFSSVLHWILTEILKVFLKKSRIRKIICQKIEAIIFINSNIFLGSS